MGCLDSVARLLLVIINIIFLLVGLGITTVGFILRYGKAIYGPFLETGMNQLDKAIKDTTLGNFNVQDIDIGEVVLSLAVGLIVGGLVLVAISFIGCCGACCKVTLMLWIYAIVIIVCIVAEGVTIGLLYGKQDKVKENLKESLSDYEGLKSSAVFSLVWNIVMIQFKCCGVDDYTDFSNPGKWTPLNIGSITVNLDTPIACCKELPTSATIGNCAANPFVKTKNNWDQGCYDKIWDMSFGNTAIAVPVLVVGGIIQLMFIVFAIMVAKAQDGKISPI